MSERASACVSKSNKAASQFKASLYRSRPSPSFVLVSLKTTVRSALAAGLGFGLGLGVAAQPSSSPAPAGAQAQPLPSPHEADLGDLRALVAKGQFPAAEDLSGKVLRHYERLRDASQPAEAGYVLGSCMVAYSLFARAEVLALAGHGAVAEAALAQARDYRSRHPETHLPANASLWQEAEACTAGLVAEAKGDGEGAMRAYRDDPDSPKSCSRLALLEFGRGRIDQARQWALIHADDPVSQYVLAQLALRTKNAAAARQHADRAWQEFAREEQGAKELLPIQFCEASRLAAFRAKLPKPPPRPSAP